MVASIRKNVCSLGLTHCFFLAFLFYSDVIQANNYEWVGSLISNRQGFYTYKVVFSVEKGVIKGYTVSDLGGRNETRTQISGHFDEKSGKFDFKEFELVYTQYGKNPDHLCYVSVEGKLNRKAEPQRIIARYKGYYAHNKQICDQGRLVLMPVKVVYQSMQTVKKQLEKRKDGDSLARNVLQALEPVKDIQEVKEASANSQIRFSWKSNFLHMEVWDEAVEDDDQISILVNDSLVVKNLSIHKNRKSLQIPLRSNMLNRIKIVAVNEGKFAPNTVKVHCIDTTTGYLILSQLNQYESFQILIDTRRTNP